MRCPICNEILSTLNTTHLRKHKHTYETFLKEYPKYYQYTEMALNDLAFCRNPRNAERKKEYKEAMKING